MGPNAKNNWTLNPTFEMKKVLLACSKNAQSNAWADGITDDAPDVENFQILHFNQSDLSERYRELSPKGIVDLVVIDAPGQCR